MSLTPPNSGRSPLDKSQAEQYAAIFRALAEPLRLEIVSLFDDDDNCACTLLEDVLPISKSTVSYHVKILNEAGLLKISKEGRYYHYHLRRDVFDYFLPHLLDRLKEG